MKDVIVVVKGCLAAWGDDGPDCKFHYHGACTALETHRNIPWEDEDGDFLPYGIRPEWCPLNSQRIIFCAPTKSQE